MPTEIWRGRAMDRDDVVLPSRDIVEVKKNLGITCEYSAIYLLLHNIFDASCLYLMWYQLMESLPPYLALGEQLQESEANEKTCHNFNYSHHKWFCWIWNMSRQQRCLCLSVTGVVGTLLGMMQPDNQVPKARIDWLTAVWTTWFHSIPRKHHGRCGQENRSRRS